MEGNHMEGNHVEGRQVEDKSIKIENGLALIVLGILGLLTPFLTDLLVDKQSTVVWLIDLAANFQALYLILVAIGLLLSLRKHRRYIWVVIFLPLPWLTAHEKAPRGVQGTQSLKVITANTNFKNPSLDSLKALIDSESPDIVILPELSFIQAKQLASLSEYPFQDLQPDNSPFGLGVLSKLPFAGVTVDWNWRGSSLKIPTIEIIADWNSQLIKLVAFHPMPPIASEFHAARNMKLKEIVNASKQQGLKTIIAGDFNATPWSSAFSDIDYKRATGLLPTWPLRYFGIPVDQVLVSEHWGVVNQQIGPDIGSDHFPVILDVTLLAGSYKRQD